LKIWFDDQIFTIQQYGGISRYYIELIRGLNQTQQVHVDAPLHINCHLDATGDSTGKRIPSVRGVTRFCQAANRVGMARRMRDFSPDIIHETYFRSRSDASCLPRVLTVYDMIHELFTEAGRTDTLGRARRDAVARADHVLCISENTRQDLIDILGVDKKKTSVVYLAASMPTSEETGLVPDSPYILYVGPRGRYKNFDCLLQAYASRARVNKDFILVCFGGGALSDDEKARISDMGLAEGQVLQMGGSDRVLADLYRHASVFVYPSLYEGFGIPPLEAMQCNCPVICTNRSSLPEVVGDAAFMFDPESVESLGSSLELVVYDSSCRQSLIDKGRSRVASFSWSRCVDQTLQKYREIAGGRC